MTLVMALCQINLISQTGIQKRCLTFEIDFTALLRCNRYSKIKICTFILIVIRPYFSTMFFYDIFTNL